MRKFLLLVAALLTAGVASAQPIGVKVVKDASNGRLLVRADDGTWLAIYGSGAPSFSTFLAENVPAGALYFNTANGASYGRASGSWSGSTVTNVTPATTTVGTSTNCFLYADASSVLQCGSAFVANDSGAGNGVFTVLKTPSGTSATSNFLNVTGTLPTAVGVPVVGAEFAFTTQGSSVQNQRGLQVDLLPGISSTAGTFGILALNSVAGQNAATIYNVGGNISLYGATSGTSSVLHNTGVYGVASGAGTINLGVYGKATASTGSALNNIGGMFQALNGSASNVGVMGVLFGSEFYSSSPQLPFTAGGFFSNGTQAANILIAQDNTSNSVIPTTAASAVWWVGDGAWSYLGNGVLTSATMTAETQARQSGSLIHSYTWTNAQVVALGAALTGDIKVATLPAKTVVKNAYVVITGQGAGVTTLTVAFGRVSAGYIDYIVASDAKAAANTVYGDASGERGTNLTGYDLPSYTATTDVYCHFISTGANLDQVTGSTGRVIIETALVP